MSAYGSTEWHLLKWGGYIRYHRYEDLGYPKKCTFIDGPGVIRSTSLNDSLPEEVEIIDMIVSNNEFKSVYRFVLYCRYVFRLSNRKVEKKYNYGREKFRREIKKAEEEVSRQLETRLSYATN